MTLQVPNTEQWADLASRVSPNKTFYGTCNTAADATEKAATVPKFTSADLQTGVRVAITMTNEQSASGTVTLNINDLGAVAIDYPQWVAQDTIDCVYDGTQWRLMGDASAEIDFNRYDKGQRLFTDVAVDGVMDINDTFAPSPVKTLALSDINGSAQEGEVFSIDEEWTLREYPFLEKLTLTFNGGEVDDTANWILSTIDCPEDFNPEYMWVNFHGNMGGYINPHFSNTLVDGTLTKPMGNQVKIISTSPLQVALYNNGALVEATAQTVNPYDYVYLAEKNIFTREEIGIDKVWHTYQVPITQQLIAQLTSVYYNSGYTGGDSDGTEERPFTTPSQLNAFANANGPLIRALNHDKLYVYHSSVGEAWDINFTFEGDTRAELGSSLIDLVFSDNVAITSCGYGGISRCIFQNVFNIYFNSDYQYPTPSVGTWRYLLFSRCSFPSSWPVPSDAAGRGCLHFAGCTFNNTEGDMGELIRHKIQGLKIQDCKGCDGITVNLVDTGEDSPTSWATVEVDDSVKTLRVGLRDNPRCRIACTGTQTKVMLDQDTEYGGSNISTASVVFRSTNPTNGYMTKPYHLFDYSLPGTTIYLSEMAISGVTYTDANSSLVIEGCGSTTQSSIYATSNTAYQPRVSVVEVNDANQSHFTFSNGNYYLSITPATYKG